MKLMIVSWKLQSSKLIFLIFYDKYPVGLTDTYLPIYILHIIISEYRVLFPHFVLCLGFVLLIFNMDTLT